MVKKRSLMAPGVSGVHPWRASGSSSAMCTSHELDGGRRAPSRLGKLLRGQPLLHRACPSALGPRGQLGRASLLPSPPPPGVSTHAPGRDGGEGLFILAGSGVGVAFGGWAVTCASLCGGAGRLPGHVTALESADAAEGLKRRGRGARPQ